MPRRALFVDRDGTLCERPGSGAERHPLRLLPDAAASVRRLNQGGFQVIVVTDQPGVAFDEFDEDVLADAHEKLRLLLLEEGARLDGIYHCPHHPEGRIERYRSDCACRGPGTALFERARDEMGVDLAGSFFVCDSPLGLRAAASAGIRPILVRVERTRESVARIEQLAGTSLDVVETLNDAASLVLRSRAATGVAVS